MDLPYRTMEPQKEPKLNFLLSKVIAGFLYMGYWQDFHSSSRKVASVIDKWLGIVAPRLDYLVCKDKPMLTVVSLSFLELEDLVKSAIPIEEFREWHLFKEEFYDISRMDDPGIPFSCYSSYHAYSPHTDVHGKPQFNGQEDLEAFAHELTQFLWREALHDEEKRLCLLHENKKKRVGKPTRRIASGHYIVFSYPVSEDHMACFDLVSDVPVTTYVVDKEGLDAFDRRETAVKSYGGETRKLEHSIDALIPSGLDWWLIIHNDGDHEASVRHAVLV